MQIIILSRASWQSTIKFHTCFDASRISRPRKMMYTRVAQREGKSSRKAEDVLLIAKSQADQNCSRANTRTAFSFQSSSYKLIQIKSGVSMRSKKASIIPFFTPHFSKGFSGIRKMIKLVNFSLFKVFF